MSFSQKTSVSIPSTPTIFTPSDLTPSPETPPTLLPAFFTPRAPRCAPSPDPPSPQKIDVSDDDMAPIKTTELFRGNSTTEKAHTWLCTLEQTWKWDADDKEKIKLTAAEKLMWVALMVAFEAKWVKPKATRRVQDVVIAELTNNCLYRNTLGKYVNDEDGVPILSHIAWAEVMRELLSERPSGDAGMMLKSGVRATLPVKFRHLINDTGLDTWEKYLKAVEDVSDDRINDAIKEHTERQNKNDSDIITSHRNNPNAMPAQHHAHFEVFANQLAMDLRLSHVLQSPSRTASPASPRYVPPAARQSQPPVFTTTQPGTPSTRAYQTTPSTTLNTPRVPWSSRTSPDIFGGSTVRPGPNLFTKNLLATPPSSSAGRNHPLSLSGEPARDMEVCRHIAQKPRIYASDAAGIQSCMADIAAWMSQNRSSPAPDYTTYPLSPGTAGAGSRECFRCGVLTTPPHFGQRACIAQNGCEVLQKEQNLRNAVGAILYPPGQRTPSCISQIHEIPYDLFGGYNPDEPLFEEVESENGEESTN
ncbi:hypothetical protein B0H10DRAFT_2224713 [Mycena sp. CBHHK59/15]|nr:hypothetical protein B0H10DRAFT_2224713 [Mycena sp. CBHHK59/15]